MKTWAFQYCF